MMKIRIAKKIMKAKHEDRHAEHQIAAATVRVYRDARRSAKKA